MVLYGVDKYEARREIMVHFQISSPNKINYIILGRLTFPISYMVPKRTFIYLFNGTGNMFRLYY